MAIQAQWNGMKWQVSKKKAAFLNGFSTSFKIETDTNADKEGESPTEEVGRALIEVTFSTTYMNELGTGSTRKIISKWKSKVGKAAPLIIAKKRWGPPKMQLISVDVNDVYINELGHFRQATLSFTFREFAAEASGAKTTSTTETESKSGTAVKATTEDKKNKKMLSI